MEKLFDDKIRSNLEYAQHQQDTYEFYDGSALEEFVLVREKLRMCFGIMVGCEVEFVAT